jgi:uncharacterized Ntn-hydrolase superfamily protein
LFNQKNRWNMNRLPSRYIPTAWLLGFLSLAVSAAEPMPHGADRSRVPRSQITATFSIVAVDPASGVCGAAVASKYPAVGKVVPIAVGGVGAFCTQHYHVPKWRQQAIDLLREKVRPEDVLTRLLKDDPQPEQRQLAIIDALGRTAVHNPTQAPAESRYWGAMTGRDYCCQGNTLAGREVIVEMARAFEETRGSLADRLVAALAAGDRVGGDHRGRLAAGIRVAKPGLDGDWLALDVDKSNDAVEELVLRYQELRHEAKGDARIPPKAAKTGE